MNICEKLGVRTISAKGDGTCTNLELRQRDSNPLNRNRNLKYENNA